MEGIKGTPLLKEEVMQLITLIEANPIICNKATDATHNRIKCSVWRKITNNFNAMIETHPRTPDQLRLKWDNLKKAARRRTEKMRNSDQQIPGYVAPDEVLEKVSEIIRNHKTSPPKVEEVLIPNNTDNTVPKANHLAVKLKRIACSSSSGAETSNQQPTSDLRASIIKRNLAIASYYESKKKYEEEIAVIKKRKLELEVQDLESKLYIDVVYKPK